MTVPIHPICHRNLHATFSNKELEKLEGARSAIIAEPDMARFLAWIGGKHPDFHAVTRRRK